MAHKITSKKISGWVVFVGIMIFVAGTALLIHIQFEKYEAGIVDVYANQQDGYVQLVLDQINIVEDRDSQEIVEDILGTLDASSNRYWTLAEKDSLVFVKDALETNRYKGFTTRTYFASNSAESFIQSLETNKVTHKIITVEGREYVASGVRFEYNQQIYYMCLLTGRQIILEQNQYLNAKIMLFVLGCVVLAAFVILGMILVLYGEYWRKAYRTETKQTKALIEKIEILNHELTKDLYINTKYTAFYPNALPLLLDKIEDRDVWPVHIYEIDCKNQEEFLKLAGISLEKSVLRVLLKEESILLLSLKEKEAMQQQMSDFLEKNQADIKKEMVIEEKPKMSLSQTVAEFLKGI